MNRTFLPAFVAMCLSTVVAESAEPIAANVTRNWPRWRGPLDLGSTSQGRYPSGWSDGKNIQWKTRLPGIGCSTPAVWNEHILLTCPVEGQDSIMSFDWDGKVRWKTAIHSERTGKHRNGSGCNPSPVTDGKTIFVYFKSGALAAVDFDGNPLWKTNLQERFGKDTLYWDLGTSPVLTESAVIVAVMQSGGSYLAAFDKKSGDLRWKVDRNYATPVEGDHSYATPLLIEHDGKPALLVWGAERLTLHSVDDGSILWTCSEFNPQQNGNWVVVASAIVAGDIAIVPYGRGSHLAGIRLGGSGDVTETHKLWTRTDTGVFVPSPVVYEGRVYLVRDGGEVECLDPKTGKTLWSDRFPKNRNKFYASPLIADGKIYAPREDGVILVASIADKFEILSENDMHERLIASPVAIDNRMLIRGEEHLYCIGQ